MSIPSWQQRIIATVSKSPPKIALTGILLLLFLLPLTSSCTLAQMPEKRISRERSPEATPQQQPSNNNGSQESIADQGRQRRILRERSPGTTPQQQPSDNNDSQERITYQGRLRTYILHTPKDYTPNRSMPLVLVFHGGNGRGRSVQRNSGFNDLADQQGFFVAYPDGIDRHWNDGRLDTDNPDVDDVGFVAALIDHLVKTKNIDSSRVYATGISNGGAMVLKLACDLSDKIAAFAPIASSLSVRLASSCKPSKPVSILMFNSPDDPYMPWEGGMGRGRGGMKLSVPETVEWWRKHNDCSPQADNNTLPMTAASDGTRVRVSRYSGGRSDTEVVLYTIEGGGHTWPGGQLSRREQEFGTTSRQVDASEVMWEFFQRHALP